MSLCPKHILACRTVVSAKYPQSVNTIPGSFCPPLSTSPNMQLTKIIGNMFQLLISISHRLWSNTCVWFACYLFNSTEDESVSKRCQIRNVNLFIRTQLDILCYDW